MNICHPPAVGKKGKAQPGLIDAVSKDMNFITVYMGMAILFSFLGLFLLWNSNDGSAWNAFTPVVFFMAFATVYFSTEWRNMSKLSEMLDRNALSLERRIKENKNK